MVRGEDEEFHRAGDGLLLLSTLSNSQSRAIKPSGWLGLPLQDRKVLEVGCGPGDHTGFFIEHGCSMVARGCAWKHPGGSGALSGRYRCTGCSTIWKIRKPVSPTRLAA